MFRRILVPLDGSDLAEQVFPHVAEVAGAFGSEVLMIGICEAEQNDEDKTCLLYIDTKAEHLRSYAGDSSVRFNAEVLIGKADLKIIDHAKEKDIGLIFMTSHGRSGVMPWSLGSTVSKVLYKACVPVIVVRAKDNSRKVEKKSIFNKILIPLDGSDSSAEVLPYIAELTSKIESEVVLYHVIEKGKHVHTLGGLDFVPYKDQDINIKKAKIIDYLEQESLKLKNTLAKVRSEVRIGEDAREIIKFAKKEDCSMIAMATHGHSGIEGWIHGSVTYKILRGSDKTVMLVPPKNICT